MSKYKGQAAVISQEQAAADIYSLWIEAPLIAAEAKAGQFLSLYTQDESRLLPRPISICEIDKEKGRLRLVYRVTGSGTGTEQFARLRAGDAVEVIGGGIGIPPMLELAKQLPGDRQIIAGYKDELFLTEDLKKYGELYVATEDGSAGTKGNVLDAVRENGLLADVIYACGPAPMLRALKTYAKEHGIVCYISLEEKMACGIGACLACVCQSKEKDSHSNVHNKRVCKDGPVFLSTEVEI